MPYITQHGKEALKKYEYHGKSYGLLKKFVLDRFWDFAFKAIPSRMAPNLVTLMGTVAIVINFLVVLWMIPDPPCEAGTCPRWIYLLSAVSLWFYQTMDNLDGRQARRTKSSSPLGQLFDHGCDAIVTVFVIMITTTIFQVSSKLLSLNILMLNLLVFWLATWEEYHTNIFVLGYINGPEEGITVLYTTYLITFFTGSEIWLVNLPDLFHWSALPPIPLNVAFAFFTMIPIAITCCVSLWHVLVHLRKENKSLRPAFLQLLTFGLFAGSVYLWYYLASEFWITHSRLLQFACGILFSELVGRLIVAHLCREQLPLIPRPLFLLTLPLINSLLIHCFKVAIFNEFYATLLFTCGVLFSYGHFAHGVIAEICALLHIHCFKLRNESQTNGFKIH